MAIPTRPVQDGLLDPVWGQWVHDILANVMVAASRVAKTTDAFGDFSVPKPTGMATVLYASCALSRDAAASIVAFRAADLTWTVKNTANNTTLNNWGISCDLLIIGTRSPTAELDAPNLLPAPEESAPVEIPDDWTGAPEGWTPDA